MPKRVIAYVDGYNLYYGLKALARQQPEAKHNYWLNVPALARNLLKPDQQLIFTRYFTTRVSSPEDKRIRQNTFLEALNTLPEYEVQYGQFLSKTRTCRQCKHSYETHHEKMTDVNISVAMMADAFLDRFDTALLITADSDLMGPVRAVRSLFPHKMVDIAFPPHRFSNALKGAATSHQTIKQKTLSQSVFPPEVVRADGYILACPLEWR